MMMPSFGYYQNKDFINVVYAMDIAIEQHFSGMLFSSDTSRIVYSSNALAMRKRSRGKDWEESLLPFMNYRMTGIQKGMEDERAFGAYPSIVGWPVEGIEKRVRFTPITVEYEATLWFHQPLDTMIAYEKIIWDAHLETFIPFQVTIRNGEKEVDLSLRARLLYSETYNPEYTDREWLEQNKIESIALNFSMETLSLTYGGDIVIPNTVVMNFIAKKGEDVTLEEYFET